MRNGRRPDYKVMIAVPFQGKHSKFKYFQVGSAWKNQDDWFNFTLITMPDVRFRLIPVDDKPDPRRDTYE